MWFNSAFKGLTGARDLKEKYIFVTSNTEEQALRHLVLCAVGNKQLPLQTERKE